MSALLAVHWAVTWALIGLIWTVQLVLYPLFTQVSAEKFAAYHGRHMRHMTLLVVPLVAAEFITAAALVIRGAREPWLLASFAPMVFNWFSTLCVQAPLHLRLAAVNDPATLRRLLATNWCRTLAWTLRGACLLLGLG